MSASHGPTKRSHSITYARVVALGAHPPAQSTPIKIAATRPSCAGPSSRTAAQKLLCSALLCVPMEGKKRPFKSKSGPKPYADGDNGYWRGNPMISSSQYCHNVYSLWTNCVLPSPSIKYVCCSENHGRLQSAADKSEHQVCGLSDCGDWLLPLSVVGKFQ